MLLHFSHVKLMLFVMLQANYAFKKDIMICRKNIKINSINITGKMYLSGPCMWMAHLTQ